VSFTTTIDAHRRGNEQRARPGIPVRQADRPRHDQQRNADHDQQPEEAEEQRREESSKSDHNHWRNLPVPNRKSGRLIGVNFCLDRILKSHKPAGIAAIRMSRRPARPAKPTGLGETVFLHRE
jgi:hypothetical protein